MNNDFLRHGKEYPTDVSSMVTWLLKRRGKASSKKEDDTTDGFAQVTPKRKKKCVHCGKDGHLASDCYSLTPAKRAEYKEWQSVRKSDDSSVSSNDSSRSVSNKPTSFG